jgi:hypothetical protein
MDIRHDPQQGTVTVELSPTEASAPAGKTMFSTALVQRLKRWGSPEMSKETSGALTMVWQCVPAQVPKLRQAVQDAVRSAK